MNCCQREAVTGDGAEVQEPVAFRVYMSRRALAGCPAPLYTVSRRLPSFSGAQLAASAATGKIRVFVPDVLTFVSFPRCAVTSRASRPLLVLRSLLGASYFPFVLINPGQLSLGKVRGGRSHGALILASHVSLPPTLGLLEGQGWLAPIDPAENGSRELSEFNK